MEERGTGIRGMRRAMLDYGLGVPHLQMIPRLCHDLRPDEGVPKVFEATEDFLKTTLFETRGSNPSAEKLNEIEKT